MSYFIYNGISSTEMGVRIRSKNVYSAPKYNTSTISIPGRDGELLNPCGRFDNATISYTCFVPAKSIQELSNKITQIKNWLYEGVNEYHDLTDSYDTDFKRKAVFNNKLDISDEVRKIGLFTISFSCLPYRYFIDGLESITYGITAGTANIIRLNNPFSFTAKPYIKVYGNGDGTLVVQNAEGNKVWQLDIDDFLEIDADTMNFYKGTESRNNKVMGDGFPTFSKGGNDISISGNITSVEVIPRWRSL